MKDRFTRGLLAGIIAAIFILFLSLGLYLLNQSKLLWVDVASVLIYGSKSTSLAERVFAEMGVLLFSGLMGITYAYIITNINSNNHLLKGFIYGEVIWFGTFAITLLFNVAEFRNIALISSILNFIKAGTWGILTSEILYRLDKKLVS